MALTIHTTLGDIKIELFCEECHDACFNFLALCASGFYNGLFFHRIIPNFLIQAGDNSKKGDGGESATGNPIPVQNTSNFDEPGIIGYADENEVRSQFFITLGPQPQLNDKYCGFGHVIYGMNIVETISRSAILEDYCPLVPVRITHITIHYNPLAE